MTSKLTIARKLTITIAVVRVRSSLPSAIVAAIALAVVSCGHYGSQITSANGSPSSNPVSRSSSSQGPGPVSPVSSSQSRNPASSGQQPRPVNPVSNGGTSTACPTQGLGGDSLPPLCAAPAPSPKGITLPPGTPPALVPLPAATGTIPYCEDPTVTGISPGQGSEIGGDTVTVTGTGFGPDVKVFFGSTPAQLGTFESSTEITVTNPPGQAGESVDVTVDCNGSVSPVVASDQFTYVALTPSSSVTATAGP
jgi:hypothetical protein